MEYTITVMFAFWGYWADDISKPTLVIVKLITNINNLSIC